MSSKLFFQSSPRAAAVCGLQTALVALIALVMSGTAALAAPVDVFFNGNRPASNPSTAFGISLESALAAQTNGVPLITTVELLTTIANRVSVTIPKPSTLVVTPNPPTAAQNRADSNWKVKNISRGVLEDASYLLFTHTVPYSVGKTEIDYVDENVGLRIDGAEGWVIIRGQSEGVDYYYPALLLGTDIGARERVTASIHYVVNEALDGIRKNGRTKYHLPKLQLGFARVVIPEPATALLLGIGLTVLAAQRKRA